MRYWREYKAGLRKRGDLTWWFSEHAMAAWQAPTGEKPGGPILGYRSPERLVSLQQPFAGMIIELFGIAHVALKHVERLVARHFLHLEEACTVSGRTG